MRTRLMVLLTMPLLAASASAQATGGTGGAGGAGGGAQAAQRQAAANKPRTIDGINTVWLEELTQPEFRDMIKDGYTTVLVMTGGVENNDGNLQMNKHNINIKLLGEMMARKMGKTLVAPLVTLEPGNAGANIQPGRAGPMLSQATYAALLFDMGNYLRSMGFKEIYYMGDSGGNGRGMQSAADSLTKVYADSPDKVSFKHIPEFYNHTSVVQPYIQNDLKIPEGIKIGASTGTSGLHEELGIDATMALADPQSIRFAQRVKAGQAEINGIKFESLKWLQDLGRKVADLRVTTAINAITAYRATLPKP
ncbi:creatininase family protein [Gemmatimonas groenlandica]|uniref:Creatininase family protein n=1 Tax=Gemmatimonas groenlandica TaxID=2732249 RepID=A0A6M4IM89_9BACT|nr:creatininase family protein [Gemmatimonas groenlandica]QJR35793.1 creatininase family protein [Gemmatimonas groenlandica]